MTAGLVALEATTGTTTLVPYLWVKSPQLIRRSSTHRFHLQVPRLDYNTGYKNSNLNNDHQATHLINYSDDFKLADIFSLCPASRCITNKQFRRQWEFSKLSTLNTLRPGPRFTNGFSIAIQIRWKFRITLILILIQWSLQNFVHGTTAVLSWHVQKFVAI